jgi:2-dehydro-3-deoxyglucarate aldolase/4-hydroxy-2-oxoheptanedioate aldolase
MPSARVVPPGLRGPGSTTFGTWLKLPSLETVELLALAGFEFVVIDLEHSPLTLEHAYQAIVVAQGLGMTALVRVPDRTGSHVQRLLDAGADGILVPQVSSAEEARRCVGQMVFAPQGRRGQGSTSRAGQWGLRAAPDYLATGDQIVRAVQLEDRSALEVMDDILDAPGLNAVFLGMGDLTLSSGLPASAPELQALTDKLLAATSARGLACGTAVGDAPAALAAAERGFSFMMVSNDATIFGRAAAELGAAVATGLAARRAGDHLPHDG